MSADPSPAPPLAGSGDPHNAFTVDLEEWFHVCGVERASVRAMGRRSLRESSRPRGGCSTRSIGPTSRATFFVVGWVAERFPRLVEAVRDAGHEIGSHGHAHRRVYELDGEAFRRDLQASVRALEGRRRRRGVVVQGARMVRERPFALGARRARRGGLSARREHGSVDDGRIASAFRGIRTCGRPPPGRSSRCRRSWPIGSDR